jgi:hypothetical protein
MARFVCAHCGHAPIRLLDHVSQDSPLDHYFCQACMAISTFPKEEAHPPLPRPPP